MTLRRVAETFANMVRSRLLVTVLSVDALTLGSAPGYP